MDRPRALRLLAAALFAPSLALPATPAVAQTPPAVTVRLGAQTTWNGPERPTLDVRFSATNVGSAPLEDLSIGVVMFSRVTTRTQYERSLVEDPIPAIVIHADTLARVGAIPAGDSRVFQVSLELPFPGIDTTQSGIYPLKLELRAAGVPVATLRTPAIYLVRPPETPLQLAWTFVLDQPIGFGPDGVFATTALEQSLQRGGRLAGELRALLELARAPAQPVVDVAVSPRLLIQLARMRRGYTVIDGGSTRTVQPGAGGSALAGAALADRREVAAAPNVQLSALPFAAPELPALLSSGLARDLQVQLDRGAEVVQGFLDAAPDRAVLRPPAGVVDDATLAQLADLGVHVVLLDPGAVVRTPDPLGFALPPAAAVGPPSGSLSALLPDDAVATLLAGPSVAQDPVLGAQATLGELAAIWQERPGLSRGLALTLPEDLALPGGFFAPLERGIASAPWLSPERATDLVTAFPPGPGPLSLATPAGPGFDPGYIAELKQARRRVETIRPMLVGDADTPTRLDTALLLAESDAFLGDPASGLAFLRSVSEEAGAILGAIHVDTGQPVTLTSRTGSHIPLRVTNGADRRLRVTIRLVSQHLASSPSASVVLDAGQTQTVTFPVDLRTNGRFPVAVQIESPTGRVIGRSTMIVRSTAFNRIALVITLSAALVLLLLWARRVLPRRTS